MKTEARAAAIVLAYFAVMCMVLGVAGSSTGCAAMKPVVGSANKFDSDSYLTLVTADSVIQSTKQSLMDAKFPVGIAGTVKASLNGLITAYDVANPVYIAYHTAALNGTATPAQQAAVTSALSNVKSAQTQLVTARGGQ